VTITAAGLAVIGLTGAGANHPQRASLAALIAVEGGICDRRRGREDLDPPPPAGPCRGAASRRGRGRAVGVSDVAITYLTKAPPGLLHGLLSPWALTALIAGVIACYASARSLQIGDGIEVIALTSVAANLAAIFGGIVVFHDPIGAGALAITARFLAFCLVFAGAALMPAPIRATPDAA